MKEPKFFKFFFKFCFYLSLALLLAWSSQAEALCVSKSRANLRSGPGLKFEKEWQVFKFMPFDTLDKKGAWYKVKDVDGEIFWIFDKLVSKKFKCAVVKKNQTNLREGPGTKFPKVPWAPVNKYFSMKVLEAKNNWVRIEDSVGDKAWIYMPLVWIK
jgi:SH3-like domain-containing protein|tara:strand:+ start:1099 stop:1569 length:471 start_codon:yes stop_codon:yes gene_type:complete